MYGKKTKVHFLKNREGARRAPRRSPCASFIRGDVMEKCKNMEKKDTWFPLRKVDLGQRAEDGRVRRLLKVGI